MTQSRDEIWTEAMSAAQAFAEKHHIQWYELRNAVIEHNLREMPEMRGHGIGSSDGNHMIVSAVRAGELEEICRDLVLRGQLIADVAASSGKTPDEALASLRAFFAPA